MAQVLTPNQIADQKFFNLYRDGSGQYIVKISPKRKGDDSITVGVGSTTVTFFPNAPLPATITEIVKEDTNNINNGIYSFASKAQYGLPHVMESYSALVQKTSADGIRYKEATGYHLKYVSDVDIFVNTFDMVSLYNRGNSRLSDQFTSPPMGAPTTFEEVDLSYNFVYATTSGDITYLLDSGGKIYTLSKNKNLFYGGWSVELDDELDQKISEYSLENELSVIAQDGTSSPAKAVEIVYANNRMSIRLNNGMGLYAIRRRFKNGIGASSWSVHATSSTKVVRIDKSGAFISAQSTMIVGDNGVLGYGAPTSSQINSGHSGKYATSFASHQVTSKDLKPSNPYQSAFPDVVFSAPIKNDYFLSAPELIFYASFQGYSTSVQIYGTDLGLSKGKIYSNPETTARLCCTTTTTPVNIVRAGKVPVGPMSMQKLTESETASNTALLSSLGMSAFQSLCFAQISEYV